jgi:hypothetical protein
MKTKNLLSILVAFTIILAYGCKKDEENGTPTGGGAADPLAEVGAIPSSFTKKIVMEKYTGEWCVNCPDGAKRMKEVLDAFPNKSFGVEIHQNDWLELPQLSILRTHLGGIAGYPRASIDRVPASGTTSPNQDGLVVYSRGNWMGMSTKLASYSTDAGLALKTTLNGDKLNIEVFAAALKDLSSDTRLTVYILENNIVAKNQVGGSAGYTHQHVLRQVVSEGLGDKITLKAGEYITKEYKDIDVSGFDKTNIQVLAFINVVGASSSEHSIINAQEVKVGETKKWN